MACPYYLFIINLHVEPDNITESISILPLVSCYAVSFMKAYEVYIENNDLFFARGAPVKVYWSPQTILPVESPGSYSVDIHLMELNLTSGKWQHLVTMETNLANNGSAEVRIPEIKALEIGALEDFGSSVSPVVVQVSVSSASTSAKATSKRQTVSNVLRKLGRFALRTLKNSPVRYLRKLARQAAQRLLCEAWSTLQPANIGQDILDRLPSCPRTATDAMVLQNDFKEETLSSLIRVVGQVQKFFNTSIIDDKFREFFHPNTSSCFRQKVRDRSATYVYKNYKQVNKCIKNLQRFFMIHYHSFGTLLTD